MALDALEQQPAPRTPREPLVDGHGRLIEDLRISVTDRCNLRCRYCMPAEGLPWLAKDEHLTDDEWVRVVGVLGAMGVRALRVSGGEPLLRKGLPALVARLVPLVDEVSLTTNGVLLERDAPALAAAGLARVNVSLDALDAGRFAQLTRRDDLGRVLAGLDAAVAQPTLRPIKVNVVALKDFTEAEVVGFAAFARETGFSVRFIEVMPLDADRKWDADQVLPGAEVQRLVEAVHPLVPVPAPRSSTSRRFAFADGAPGELGFVNPVTQPFCGTCDRIRLTADGHLRTCLFSQRETNVRDALRGGATDDELDRLLRDAVWRKELKHHVGEPGFVQPERTMSRIGG